MDRFGGDAKMTQYGIVGHFIFLAPYLALSSYDYVYLSLAFEIHNNCRYRQNFMAVSLEYLLSNAFKSPFCFENIFKKSA